MRNVLLIESLEDAADVDSLSLESAVAGESSSSDGFVYNIPSSEKFAQDLEYAKNSAITDFVDIKTVYESLASDEIFAYGHTDFVRTRATAENIAIGRGETTEHPAIAIPHFRKGNLLSRRYCGCREK